MKNKILYILLALTIFSLPVFSQEEKEKDWTDEEKKGGHLFFAGVNVGALFSNNNTAAIYSGGYNATPFGIGYILGLPQYQATLNAYFKYPYALSELPISAAYKTALNLGVHAGVNLDEMSAIFIDINIAQLKYEQYFTIAIDNPVNQSVDPDYEKIPILGEEKRLNINLGSQLSLYNEGSTNVYWSLFGNLNSIKLERNYIIINNRQYEIIHHTSSTQSNTKPGRTGFGAGTGLGLKYRLSNRVVVDFTYNLYYIKTTMTEEIQGFGIHNGLMLRVIWN